VLADQTDGPPGLLALGIEPEPPKQLQDVERVGPVVRPRPAAPLAVRGLEREQPGTQPAVATRDRSAAATSAGSNVRSRITCQRIAGSESSSQSVTAFIPPIVREHPDRL
jgi:hypothetical protein